MVPFSQSTRKRQSAFYLVSITYILVYFFSVSITGAEEVGIKVAMPEEFAPTFLFVGSVFLGVRYALDVWGEFNFFTWLSVEKDEIAKLTSSIEQCSELKRLSEHELDQQSCRVLTHGEPACLPPHLHNFRVNLVNEISKKGEQGGREFLATSRNWLSVNSEEAIKRYKRDRILRHLGVANISGLMLFDIVLPTVLLATSVYIFFFQPDWLTYSR